MPSLRSLQTDFLDAILSGELEGATPLLACGRGTGRAAPARRLAVYQNNVRANFIESLHSSFPALWRLVGEDYFRQIAGAYHRSYPSRSGDLLHAGRDFPDYVAKLHRADEYRYLADIARLEWLCQEALLAAAHAPLDLDRLRLIAPTAYDALRFELHPAVRLYASAYPALRIWEANVASEADPELIDLAGGADCLAVTRHELELKFYRLGPGEYAFLSALQCGMVFSAALEAGSGCDADFDAAAALRRFVAAEVIVDFQ
jgi:hypothetical protein